jgi:preprotein translocase subunit SecG
MILAVAWYHTILAFLFAVVAILLMIVILLQRGKGVGIAGFLGGSAGATAFGAKTGDVLTWITVFGTALLLTFTVVLNYIFVEAPTPVLPAAPVSAPGPAPVAPMPQPMPISPGAVPMQGGPMQTPQPMPMPVNPGATPPARPPAPPPQPAPASPSSEAPRPHELPPVALVIFGVELT